MVENRERDEMTGFYDVHGIPIHVGDLIRVKHFKHYRNRRQMWLYFRVAEKLTGFVVQNWNDLDVTNHQCLLKDCGLETAEVIAETGFSGITFNERKRHGLG